MKKYISLEDISYKSGDKINIHWEGGGFITTGGKSFRMTIPVDRPVMASSAKLTGTLTLRQSTKYIYGSANESTDISTLNQSCQRITPAGISFALENPNGYTNAENNSSCGILFVGTITFI